MKQISRTCVVCRRKDQKGSLLRFGIFESRASLSLSKTELGRSFYLHPKCFGSEKVITAIEYQLKRCKCSVEEHSFMLKQLPKYLRQQISALGTCSKSGFIKVKKIKMEEALLSLNSKEKKSQRVDLTNKGDLAKKKIRL